MRAATGQADPVGTSVHLTDCDQVTFELSLREWRRKNLTSVPPGPCGSAPSHHVNGGKALISMLALIVSQASIKRSSFCCHIGQSFKTVNENIINKTQPNVPVTSQKSKRNSSNPVDDQLLHQWETVCFQRLILSGEQQRHGNSVT